MKGCLGRPRFRDGRTLSGEHRHTGRHKGGLRILGMGGRAGGRKRGPNVRFYSESRCNLTVGDQGKAKRQNARGEPNPPPKKEKKKKKEGGDT